MSGGQTIASTKLMPVLSANIYLNTIQEINEICLEIENKLEFVFAERNTTIEQNVQPETVLEEKLARLRERIERINRLIKV